MIGGHVVGLLILKLFIEVFGIFESMYCWFLVIVGAVVGAVCAIGFFGFVYCCVINVRVRCIILCTDFFVYFLFVVLIGFGCWMMFGYNFVTKMLYDYCETMLVWWCLLFVLQLNVEVVIDANIVY